MLLEDHPEAVEDMLLDPAVVDHREDMLLDLAAVDHPEDTLPDLAVVAAAVDTLPVVEPESPDLPSAKEVVDMLPQLNLTPAVVVVEVVADMLPQPKEVAVEDTPHPLKEVVDTLPPLPEEIDTMLPLKEEVVVDTPLQLKEVVVVDIPPQLPLKEEAMPQVDVPEDTKKSKFETWHVIVINISYMLYIGDNF